MAESRLLPCNFWSWPTVDDLLLDQKAIAAYLLTNRFTNAAGCYELPRRLAAGELGIAVNVLEEALRQFAGLKLVELDLETGEVLIVAWFRFHKFTTGPQLANFWHARNKILSPRLKKLVVDKSVTVGVPQGSAKSKLVEIQGAVKQHQPQHQRQQKADSDYDSKLSASAGAIQGCAPKLAAGTRLR